MLEWSFFMVWQDALFTSERRLRVVVLSLWPRFLSLFGLLRWLCLVVMFVDVLWVLVIFYFWLLLYFMYVPFFMSSLCFVSQVCHVFPCLFIPCPNVKLMCPCLDFSLCVTSCLFVCLFMLPLLMCLMFSFASPVSLVRFVPAVFPPVADLLVVLCI